MSPVSEVEGYCLRWNNHHGTLIDVLQSLYQEQSFVDCTLAADGKSIQVHRLVLCAVSPYFQVCTLMNNNVHLINLCSSNTGTSIQRQ
jgi:hypothetical protein